MTDRLPAPTELKAFQEALLSWFAEHARSFPWRQTRDPYRVLTAEMLLQQTDADSVLPVYEELILRYPTPAELANADKPELEALIAPLGLRYRAERLQASAAALAAGVPPEEKALMKLKGVGRYIARAVLCFAYGAQVGILDSNVIRLLDRVFSIRSEKARPHTDPAMWKLVDMMVPEGEARQFNLALLDLAALVCRSAKPRCEICPLHMCRWSRSAKGPTSEAPPAQDAQPAADC